VFQELTSQASIGQILEVWDISPPGQREGAVRPGTRYTSSLT